MGIITVTILCMEIFSVPVAFAYVPLTNNNVRVAPHPKPVATGADLGSASAIPLENGSTFRIERNEIEGVRLWKFSVDNAYWWVTDRGIIWGSSTLSMIPQAETNENAYQVYLTLPQKGE